MIEALEIFGTLPLAMPAIVGGIVTLGAATLVVWSQKDRMRNLKAAVAAGETEES
jgi:hypothetical protein